MLVHHCDLCGEAIMEGHPKRVSYMSNIGMSFDACSKCETIFNEKIGGLRKQAEVAWKAAQEEIQNIFIKEFPFSERHFNLVRETM